MSTATPAVTPTVTVTTATTPVWRVGALAAVVAAAATEVFATVADAAGVERVAGSVGADHAEPIPAGGFATATLIWAAVGIVLAVVLARRAKRPARTFLTTTVVLTLLSFVPSLLAGATPWSTRITLCAAHVVAAAIVIPLLAARLAQVPGRR